MRTRERWYGQWNINIRCGVRVRGSLGLGVRVGVLELSSVSRLLSVPIIGSHLIILR